MKSSHFPNQWIIIINYYIYYIKYITYIMYHTHSMYITCIMHLCTCVTSMHIMHNTCYTLYIYIITVLLFFYVSAMIYLFFNVITNLRVPCHTQECSMDMTSLGSCSFWLCYVVMGTQHILELSLTKMWCDTQLES